MVQTARLTMQITDTMANIRGLLALCLVCLLMCEVKLNVFVSFNVCF